MMIGINLSLALANSESRVLGPGAGAAVLEARERRCQDGERDSDSEMVGLSRAGGRTAAAL
eukprot:737475-Rhodomonas_salina.2